MLQDVEMVYGKEVRLKLYVKFVEKLIMTIQAIIVNTVLQNVIEFQDKILYHGIKAQKILCLVGKIVKVGKVGLKKSPAKSVVRKNGSIQCKKYRPFLH